MYAMHFLNFQTRVSKYVSICQMLWFKFNILCSVEIGKRKFLVAIRKFVVLQWE